MEVPQARGALTEELGLALLGGRPMTRNVEPDDEEDLQLALWVLYELHYRGFEGVDPRREWDPGLIALRTTLEVPFEAGLRALAADRYGDDLDGATDDTDVFEAVQRIIDADDGPSLASYLHRHATEDQFREFLTLRSVYHLKESDPPAWLLPRIDGAAKVALAELLYDEFGDGRPERSHPRLYAEALAGAGLDPTYGRYVDDAPAHVLAVNNAMSLFGLNRRLRAASAGHLAAFEMTSSLPCRRIVQGAQRLGFGEPVQRYFDEHVEADAVHEHLAAQGICGALVREEPELLGDVLLGAAVCVALDAVSATALLDEWGAGRSGLRPPPLDPAA
ncbi:MAG: iron-containing redox enzyme family protein [Marmoricola sp.]